VEFLFYVQINLKNLWGPIHMNPKIQISWKEIGNWKIGIQSFKKGRALL
jgi:hypothetical protein